MNQYTRRASQKRSGAQRFVWPVLVCSVVCALIPRPGYAAPAADPGAGAGSSTTTTIPDTGALPIPSAPLGTTGTGATSTQTSVTGPFATQITAQYATLEQTGEQLKQAGIDLDAAKQAANTTYQAWQEAVANAAELRRKADNAAAQAYKDAAGLGPLAGYATDVHQLGMLEPGVNTRPGLNTGRNTGSGQTNGVTAAQDAKQAQDEADTDEAAYRAALAQEQQLETKQTQLQNSYNQQNAALIQLNKTNDTQVQAAEAAQAASDRQLDPEFGAGTAVDGKVANPKAQAAVRWAYAQATANPPKWYKFGAEGPDFFDCSGLTWASYRSTGYTLPRVAADQFHATSGSEVPPSQLLPGDLLFFSTTSDTDWRTISHVAIYYGGNMMVEAAHEGTPVRVSQIWWSAFFGATRVYPAVAATPSTAPKPPSKSPSPTPSKSGSPTPSKSPSPTPTRSSSPTPKPTHTAIPIPSKSSAPPSSPASTPTTPSTPSTGDSSSPPADTPTEGASASAVASPSRSGPV